MKSAAPPAPNAVSKRQKLRGDVRGGKPRIARKGMRLYRRRGVSAAQMKSFWNLEGRVRTSRPMRRNLNGQVVARGLAQVREYAVNG